MPIKQLETLNEIKDRLSGFKNQYDPNLVLRNANKELSKIKDRKSKSAAVEDDLFKSITLLEFDNGTLLTTVVLEQYKTFGIELMRNIQKEHNCQTSSEKATAELAAVNYIRTLEIQRRITNYLKLGTITKNGLTFLAILSKELDRANRHYLAAVQNLKMMKQTPMQLNIKTEIAIIGHNQFVQSNKND